MHKRPTTKPQTRSWAIYHIRGTPAQFIGDIYNDLGAIVHDNQGHDLSCRTFVNGVLSGNILIDTSKVATDTIDYVATDTWGNSATGTRTVIIDAAATSPSIASTTASSSAPGQ